MMATAYLDNLFAVLAFILLSLFKFRETEVVRGPSHSTSKSSDLASLFACKSIKGALICLRPCFWLYAYKGKGRRLERKFRLLDEVSQACGCSRMRILPS